MTKASIRNQAAIEARATDAVDRILTELDLGWLAVTVKFDASNKDDRIAADITCDFEYRQACLTFSLSQIALMHDEDLEDLAVHEICHALIAPLWESLSSAQQGKLYKLNELSVENVSRAISFLRRNA